MKKFAISLLCLMMIFCGVLFSACGESGNSLTLLKSSIEVEVDDQIDLSGLVATQDVSFDNLIIFSNKADVVKVQDDKTLLAKSAGDAVITISTSAGESVALGVKVYDKKVDLSVPTGLAFSSATSSLTWSSVLGASGYTVCFNGEEYSTALTSFVVDNPSVLSTAKVKANGTGKFNNSAYSSQISFVALVSPTITYNYENSKIVWTAIEGYTYAVKLNNIILAYTTEGSYSLSLSQVGQNKVSVFAFSADGYEGYYSSTYSNELSLVKLGSIENIFYDATNKIISWTSLGENAKYEISIDGGEYQECNTNQFDASSAFAQKGVYNVAVRAIGKIDNIVNSPSINKDLTVFQQLESPTITACDQTGLNITFASGSKEFEVYVNNQLIPTTATIVGLTARLDYNEIVSYANAGEYIVKVKALENTEDLFGESNFSQEFVLTKVGMVESYQIINDTSLVFANIDGAVSYDVWINNSASAINVLSADHLINLASYPAGNISIKIVARSSSSFLDGAEKTINLTKLATPTNFAYSYEDNSFSWTGVQGASSYRLVIDGVKLSTLITGESFSYSFNRGQSYSVSIFAVDDNGESVSSLKSENLIIYSLTIASLDFNKTDKQLEISNLQLGATVKVFLGEEEISSFTVSATSKTLDVASTFTTSGNYSFSVYQLINDIVSVKGKTLIISVLDAPTNVSQGTSENGKVNNIISWSAVSGATKYNVYKIYNSSYTYLTSTSSTSVDLSGLLDGGANNIALQAENDSSNTTLASNYSQLTQIYIKSQLATPSIVGFDKTTNNLTVNISDSRAQEIRVIINNESGTKVDEDVYTISSLTRNSSNYVILLDYAFEIGGKFDVAVITSSTESYIVDSEQSSAYRVIKLETCQTFYDADLNRLTWQSVENAISYEVSVYRLNSSATYDLIVSSNVSSNTYFGISSYISNDYVGTFKFNVKALATSASNIFDSQTIEVLVDRNSAAAYTIGANTITMAEIEGASYYYKIYSNSSLYASSKLDGNIISTDDVLGVAGIYSFEVYYKKAGCINSVITSFQVTKLASTSQISLQRDSVDSDFINITWHAVDNALSYVVTILCGDEQTTYPSTQNLSMQVPADLGEGENVINIIALGHQDSLVYYVSGAKKEYIVIKLADDVNIRSNNGVLTFDAPNQSGTKEYVLIVSYIDSTSGADSQYEIAYSDVSSSTITNLLDGIEGALEVRVVVRANIETGYVDSSYATKSFTKLSAPTAVTTNNGALTINTSYLSIMSEYNIGCLLQVGTKLIKISLNQDGEVQGVGDIIEEGKSYVVGAMFIDENYVINGIDVECDYLSSDWSETITVTKLKKPTNGSIVASTDKLTSTLTFDKVENASSYTITIFTQNTSTLEISIILQQNINQPSSDTVSFVINNAVNLASGLYYIQINAQGGNVDGNYISANAKVYSFNVLDKPQIEVFAGQIRWQPIANATAYYVFINSNHYFANVIQGDGYYYYDFSSVMLPDGTTPTSFDVTVKAVGNGTTTLASINSNTLAVIKPRELALLTVVDGALVYDVASSSDYTYFEYTGSYLTQFNTLKNIWTNANPNASETVYGKNVTTINNTRFVQLDFYKNDTLIQQVLVSADYLNSSAGFASEKYYLEFFTQSLDYGTYTLKCRQLGNSINMINSEYSSAITIIIPKAPTNVKIVDRVLTFDAVSYPNTTSDQVVYLIYAYNSASSVKDWECIGQTSTTSFDLSNDSGILKTTHTRIAVVTRGNTSDLSDEAKIISSEKSGAIDIVVLPEITTVETRNGVLCWGDVGSASGYLLSYIAGTLQTEFVSADNSDDISYNYSSLIEMPCGGKYSVSFRPMGDTNSGDGVFVVNASGKSGDMFVINITKLSLPTVSVQDGILTWQKVEYTNSSSVLSYAFGYDVYYGTLQANGYYGDIKKLNTEILSSETTSFESTINNTDPHSYYLTAVGGSAVGLTGGDLVISSNKTSAVYATRLSSPQNLTVSQGILSWSSVYDGAYYKVVVIGENLSGGKMTFVATTNNIDLSEYILVGNQYTAYVQAYINGVDNTKLLGLISNTYQFGTLKTPTSLTTYNGLIVFDQIGSNELYEIVVSNSSSVLATITTGFNIDNQKVYCELPSSLSAGTYFVKARTISNVSTLISSNYTDNISVVKLEVIDISTSTYDSQTSQVMWTNSNSGGDYGYYVEFSYITDNGLSTYTKVELLDNASFNPSDYVYVLQEESVSLTPQSFRVKTFEKTATGYVMSNYSNSKSLVKPSSITLEYNGASQTASFNMIASADEYIVYIKVNEDTTEIKETIRLNSSNNYSYVDQTNGNYIFTRNGNVITFIPMTTTTYTYEIMPSNTAGVGNKEILTTACSLFGSSSVQTGNGSQLSPYIISSLNQANFYNITYRPNAYYIQQSDISVSIINAIGSASNIFAGEYNGNGYKINANFNNNAINTQYFGIFYGISGVIKDWNIIVSTSSIVVDMDNGNSASTFGVLAGVINGSANISDINISGSLVVVRRELGKTFVGGCVGEIVAGTISGVTSSLTIQASVNYVAYVGGIAAKNVGGTITNSSNSGAVSGGSYVGGICATNASNITGCSNLGTLQGKSVKNYSEAYIGGIVGYNTTGNITGCSQTGTIKIVDASYTGEEIYIGGICGYTQTAVDSTNTTQNSNLSATIAGTSYTVNNSSVKVYIGTVVGFTY